MNSSEIKRLALGRKAKIGHLYSTIDDRFCFDDYSVLKAIPIKEEKFKKKLEFLGFNYGKIISDKAKLLCTQSELELSLLTGLTDDNEFIRFLKDKNDYNFNDSKIKRAVFRFQILDSKISMDMNSNVHSIIKKLNIHKLHVVNEITYGMSIIAVVLFNNKSNLPENEIIRWFYELGFSFERNKFNRFQHLDVRFRTNVIVHFIDSVEQRIYQATYNDFIIWLKKRSMVRSIQFNPIKYTLISCCNLLGEFCCIDKIDLTEISQAYNMMNQNLSLLHVEFAKISGNVSKEKHCQLDALEKQVSRNLGQMVLNIRSREISGNNNQIN